MEYNKGPHLTAALYTTDHQSLNTFEAFRTLTDDLFSPVGYKNRSEYSISLLALSHQLLSLIVPLRALPQITHYIPDGFIWKIKKEEFKWSNEH